MAWERREFPDGTRYEGDFVDGVFNGKGTLYYPDGTRYEGDFVDGVFNGKGTLFFSDVIFYEGDFVDGVFNGKGTLYYPDGTRYEGYFKKNEIHDGIMYKPDGKIDCKIKNGLIISQSSLDKTTIHFYTTLYIKPDGMRLTRDNYIDMKRISKCGIKYTKEECKKMAEDALENFDLNMQYFKTLDKEGFNEALDSFISRHPQFKEVTNLEEYEGVAGYYLMVLDEYCQVYIGTTNNIKTRIKAHWSKTMPLDRLVFGYVDRSVLSINSFRAFDTTRIFAYVTGDTFSNEDDFINDFPDEYHLNRTKGGLMQFGLKEAIDNMKNRKLR